MAIPMTTPMCDTARSIHNFKERLKHYRTCNDPRCQARSRVARDLAKLVARNCKRVQQ